VRAKARGLPAPLGTWDDPCVVQDIQLCVKSRSVDQRIRPFLNCACWWALWGVVGCSRPPQPAEPDEPCGRGTCPSGTVCRTWNETERHVSSNVSRAYGGVRRAECVVLPGHCRSDFDCPGPPYAIRECLPGKDGVGVCVNPGIPGSGYEP
jgi:hypothetical protein